MQKITLVPLTFAILITISIVPSMAIASKSGENQHIDLENTPISSIVHEDTSFDGLEFAISIKLIDEASSNGTDVEVWTQICINSGICFDPVWHCENVGGKCTSELGKSDDNSTWTVTVVPDETHTYVNYKVNLQYPLDKNNETSNEMFSSGKVWSNCWVYGEESGGECENNVPAVGTFSVITIILIAAIIRKD